MFRNQFSIEQAKQLCRTNDTDKYSVGILATGGCLCTLAAIRAGLFPIWGSEIHDPTNPWTKLCQDMWRDLTGVDSLGDATKIVPEMIRRPTIVKTGFPCQDHCPLGSQKGESGSKGGNLYVWQGHWICRLEPEIAIIEQSDHARKVKNGEAVEKLKQTLSEKYYVHEKIIPVYTMGDCSNRKRLFLIAVHLRHGSKAKDFAFPRPVYNDDRYPIAADVMIPDEDIPEEYILQGEPPIMYKWRDPTPGQIHHLGKYGDGVGDREWPHNLHSNYGLPSTQLTSNGGGRRPMLNWTPGDPIIKTQLTPPASTLMMASLSPTYGKWVRTFDESDDFLRYCVNMGVPMATSYRIDTQVIKFLEYLGVKHDMPASHTNVAMLGRVVPHNRTFVSEIQDRYGPIRSMLIDTGANGSLNFASAGEHLHDSRESIVRVKVAQKGTAMNGLMDGEMRAMVLNTAGQKGFDPMTPFSWNTTTCEGLRSELLSLDEPYRTGKWNLKIRQPDHENGVSELCRDATENQPAIHIPLRYDYKGPGGWWLDYVITDESNDINAEYAKLIQAFSIDATQDIIEPATMIRHTYTLQAANALVEELEDNPQVKSIKTAKDDEITKRLLEDDDIEYAIQWNRSEMTSTLDQPKKRTAVIAILNGQVLMRQKPSGEWSLPSSTLKETDASSIDAALRGFEDITGIESGELLMRSNGLPRSTITKNTRYFVYEIEENKWLDDDQMKIRWQGRQGVRRATDLRWFSITSLHRTFQTDKFKCEREHLDALMQLRSGGLPLISANMTSIVARHPDEKAIRGTRMGLPHGKSKMPHQAHHREHMHLGNADDCEICRLVKGAMKRWYKKVNPHRDNRPLYVFSMDAVTVNERSLEGSRYMVNLRCMATGYIKILFLYVRTDIIPELEKFIKDIRSDPDFKTEKYEAVQIILTDEPGEWGLKSERWKQLQVKYKFRSRHTTPETSKELGHAEKTNSIVETTMKCGLMEGNLPVDHWEACARMAEFFLNRYPNQATEVTEPTDGDRALPLELATQGRYSRRQIMRELAYSLPIGRLALVHQPKVKGSAIEPKVRYGIAWGMYREQVRFRCPFSGATFRSKSYRAIELEANMNAYQWLGIPYPVKSARGRLQLPSEEHEKVDIHLPHPAAPGQRKLMPVVAIKSADDNEVVEASYSLPSHELGGSVRIFDSKGMQLKADIETGILHGAEVDGEFSDPLGHGPLDDRGRPGLQWQSHPTSYLHRQRSRGNARNARGGDGDVTHGRESPEPLISDDNYGLRGDSPPDGPAIVSYDAVDTHILPSRHGYEPNESAIGEDPEQHVECGKDHQPKVVTTTVDRDKDSDPMLASVDTVMSYEDDAAHEADQIQLAGENQHARMETGDVVGPPLAEKQGPAEKQGSVVEQNESGMKCLSSSANDDIITSDDMDEVFVDLGTMEEMAVQREMEKLTCEGDAHIVKTGESFDTIARSKLSIPFELKDLYHTWLLQLKDDHGQPRFRSEDILKEKGFKVTPGLKLPPPYGKEWEDMVEKKGLKYEAKTRAKQSFIAMQEVVHHTLEAIRAATAIYYCRDEDRDTNSEDMDGTAKRTGDGQSKVYSANALRVETVVCQAKKKRRKTAIASGLPEPPSSVSKALRMEDMDEAMKWLEAINKEWDGLQKLGVFDHNFTRAQLKENGITTNPIPLVEVNTYKFDDKGNVDKFKHRKPLAGHPGNMQKGVHYDKSFAPTPTQHSSRVLLAVMVKNGLVILTFDVSQAYVQAILPENERIAIRYPEGFRRFHPETGEELFAILRRSLYGHPAAGRYWNDHRNTKIMQEFNIEGWTCKRPIKEPCMYVIKRGEEYAYMIIHTDDGDIVGTSNEFNEEILTKLNKMWECKRTDPVSMLGLQRRITEKDGVRSVEVTMTPFIEGMFEAFKSETQYDSRTNVKTRYTPIPEDLMLSKSPKDSKKHEVEGKRIIARGYQRLLGMLLWAARGVFPECLVGTSFLGRCMACPSEEAWKAGIHMLEYMYQNRTRGIKFSSDRMISNIPIAHTDASNKPDPTDSKCQYGYCIHWMGPIVFASRKLNHVGLSAAHNEYMALHWCMRHVMWLRALLIEMGLTDVVREPTIIRGDNTAANTLCEEDIVTTGNQFITTPYHYNKEVIADGHAVVEYIQTDQNIADLFTKAVKKGVIQRLLDALLGYIEVYEKTVQHK